MTDLKPCPFCGGPAGLWNYPERYNRPAWVSCMGKCVVLISKEYETDAEAIVAWNTRTDVSPWQPIETAPKNWPVLVHCPKDDRTCFTDTQLTFENGGKATWQNCRPHHQPTHWRPLPKSPKETHK